MADPKQFHRWQCTEADLADLTPIRARDLVIKCFLEAQKETYHRIKQTIGVSDTEEEVQKTVLAGIRGTFKEVGGDFENPTKESLLNVVELLSKKAKLWGTPPDIIEFHKKCMEMIFTMLNK